MSYKKTILLLLFFCSISVFGQSEAEKVALKLLDASGSSELALKMVDQMLMMKKQTMPQIPAEFWNEFKKELNADDLNNLLAPVYAKHFTIKEMKELIAFYNTPIGKKLVEKMPAISQESMAAGQQWGMKVGQRIEEKLKAKGYK